MKLKPNAITVLEKRYLTRNSNNELIESVEGLFERVATTVAAADLNYGASKDEVSRLSQDFFKLMTDLDFLPNSPTLMNAGKALGQLSACFVLPIADTMEEIFETIKNAALIHKSGGGTGFSFSRLRSKGATVNSTGGVASGPVSFMKVFNSATEAVKQGGTRRGANMGILRVDHPDVLEFIDCKKNNDDITNFNISIGITEKFMNAVENGTSYELVNPSDKKVVGKLNAKEVYDKIVTAAWSNGEPGIIFLDRLNKYNIVPSVGEFESTNPCGEQPLLPYESCNLGSINLNNMLKESFGKTVIDYDKLNATVYKCVHFLDNVIDVNKYPLELIDKTTKSTRKIGLGVMGFADMLIKMGVPYCSDECVKIAKEVMKAINDAGHQASVALAKVRGAFPLFEVSTLASGEKIRNGTITTIAPTGTLSIIGSCSSGVEPIFGYVYIRNVMDGTELIEVNELLKDTLIQRGLYSEALMKKIAAEGTLAHIDEIPSDIKKVFVCAHDISPEWHIYVQSAFQDYTDNAVSKTVNFESSATIADVDKVYRLAFKTGCKGVTIYRDGSRSNQVLNIGKVKKKEGEELKCEECPNYSELQKMNEENKVVPRPRPDIVRGFTEKVSIGCGNLYITANFDDNGIVEVFTNTGKAGGCPSQSEATARLVSVSLRSGIDVATIIEQLKGIRCPSTIRQQGMKVTSCPDAIARVLQQVVKINNGFKNTSNVNTDEKPLPIALTRDLPIAAFEPATIGNSMKFCPECGAKVEHSGGCVICRQCGFSKCN